MTDKPEGDKPNDKPDSSPELEAKVTDLEKKLSDQNASAKRIADSKAASDKALVDSQARVAELEKANETPKEDGDRIAELEVKLARSEAVSRFGLSPDDAALLKGSPDDILKDAEYWAERLKDRKADPDKDDIQTNRDIIDKKVDDAGNEIKPPGKPEPKKGGLTWLEQYKAADTIGQAKLKRAAFDGLVDPTK